MNDMPYYRKDDRYFYDFRNDEGEYLYYRKDDRYLAIIWHC